MILRRATTVLALLAAVLALGAFAGAAAAAPTAAQTVRTQSRSAGGDPCTSAHTNLCQQIPEAPLTLLFPLAAVGLVGVALVRETRRRRAEPDR